MLPVVESGDGLAVLEVAVDAVRRSICAGMRGYAIGSDAGGKGW